MNNENKDNATDNNIIFFKSLNGNEPDQYNDIFKQSSLFNSIEFIKVLDIEYNFENLKSLTSNKDSKEEYFGLVFTSSNSIKSIESFLLNNCTAVAEDTNNSMDDRILWFFNRHLKFKYIYIVGETSCKLFKDRFSVLFKSGDHNATQTYSEANATDLSKRIVMDYNNRGCGGIDGSKLLYFCGDSRRDELPIYLNNNNIQLDEIRVYKSIHSSNSINQIIKLYKDIKMGTQNVNWWLVFFSPSGVDFIFNILNEEGLSDQFWNKVKTVSIGKTTEAHLKSLHINVNIVSPAPNASSLYNTILNNINKQ